MSRRKFVWWFASYSNIQSRTKWLIWVNIATSNKTTVEYHSYARNHNTLTFYSILPFFLLHCCVDSLTVFRDPLFPFEHSFLVHGCQWSFLQTWSKNNRLNDCIYIILRILIVSYHNCRNGRRSVLTCIRSVYCHHNLPKSTLFSSLVAFLPLSSHRMPVDRLDNPLKYCGQHRQKQQRWQMQLPLRLYCNCKDEYWSRFGDILTNLKTTLE